MNLEEQLFQSPAGAQWHEVGVRNHHGLCIPLFSLHSEKSCGMGEYLDLLPLISWVREMGMDVIQLLPLNDIGLGTSPYSAISAFALNPVHLSLWALPHSDRVPSFGEKIDKIRYWTKTERIKYHIVRELKFAFFREYIPLVADEVLKSDEYQFFVDRYRFWLEPYALFKALKEELLWKHWEDWPTPLKSPSQEGFQKLLEEHKQACQFHTIIQYFCFQQLQLVKERATESEVLIKGDIPILIGRDSADVWHHRHFFLLHFAAGAPPDMYTRDGQDWGFPVYDWEALKKQDFDWWRERLEFASHLYHLYRIDHVVGFFRMWAIPDGKTAKEGIFVPAEEHEWIPHGKSLMKMMIQSAPILPIGEDLGLVPQPVKETLYSLGICGTKLMRWERQWNGDEECYIPIDRYQPMTMSTVSTHDSDTLQLWWRHFPKEAKMYSKFKGWDYRPFLTLERHKEILYDCHHTASLFHINLLQEYLALFPELVSSNPNDERINIPGKVLDTNWTYRFRPSVEQLISHPLLKQSIKEIVS